MAFDPAEYMVTEGNQRNLRVVVQGSYAIPVEVLLSTGGITARGIYTAFTNFSRSVLRKVFCICVLDF